MSVISSLPAGTAHTSNTRLADIRPAAQESGGGTQALRGEDIRLSAEAARLIAQAELAGGSASAQVSYAAGPNGEAYIASIRVTKSVPTERQQEGVISPDAATASLTDAEKRLLAQLQASDIAVRNHEALHFRTAGGIASGTPEYSYVQGPDGRYYATAGAVHVHTGSTADAEKAARDAGTLARAALAPGDASVADLQAAREAFSNVASAYGRVQERLRGEALPGTVDFSA